MNKEEHLRLKLFDIFEACAVNRTGEADYSSNFEDIAIDMEPNEWKSFCSKWNRYLKKLGVIRVASPPPRTFLSGSFINGPPKSALPHRKIPGFYSILDPVSVGSKKLFALDIPREVGDTILVLGQLPNS